MQITQFQDDRRPVMVVSHERSGTHFTMNSVAGAFGYISMPWIDLDRHQININYFHPGRLEETLQKLARARPANIVKNHHEFTFFAELIDTVARDYHLIYVYRHPADVLISYWRLLNTFSWVEGPRTATALEFAAAAPMARLLRYQYLQYPSMLDRWANHVSGWMAAAARNEAINLVRYEDLAGDHAGTMTALGARLGLAPGDLTAPSRTENVVVGGSVPFDPPPEAANRPAVAKLALARHPELMARLGYDAAGLRAEAAA
ncbi:MAG TPA: sulfotransferase domain-containing protein [Phenylobacterium sp.]|nr:sulfotransferase domain-containing protein [Phenylobacterium sp.]